MKRILKIHKNFEEIEAFDIENARNTTPLQRLSNLYYMQNFTKKLRPSTLKKRSIFIKYGYPSS